MMVMGLVLLGLTVHQCYAGRNAEKDCCGLTAAQWKAYNGAASNAVMNASEWKRLSSKRPSELRISTRGRFDGSTNSKDGKTPPTVVTINVPVTTETDHVSHVVVEFQHPSRKIVKMYATNIKY